MKAGRNTPQSVLLYIDAVWAQNQPPEPIELARELKIGPKQYRRLVEKHGDHLLKHLLKMRQERRDRDRFMARQDGLTHPEQYVENVQGAIEDAPCVPIHYQEDLDRESRIRNRRRQTDEAGDLLAVMQELRASIEAMPREKKMRVGKTLWQLRSRLDAAERELRRRIAA